MNLAILGIVKIISGILLMGALIFLPANTIHYAAGWRLLGLLFIPMIFVGIALYLKAPDLLKKRLNDKETQKDQKVVILLSSILFVGCFTVAGLDFRFGWSHFPKWLSLISCITFFLAYLLYVEVMRENAYLSRTVEIQENQQVVSTGLYGIVRHPMYFAALLLFISMPLVLESFVALLFMLPLPFVFVLRIKNEEMVLEQGLEGYKEYKEKVKYRLLPGIW